MRRSRRILINVVMGLSLALGAITLFQMIESGYVHEMIGVTMGDRSWWLDSARGSIQWGITRERPEWSDCGWIGMDTRGCRSRHGRIAASFSRDEVRLELPYWLVGTLIASPGVLLLVGRARATRRRQRFEDCWHRRVCAVCNYDLRATPDRCPECGAAPAGWAAGVAADAYRMKAG